MQIQNLYSQTLLSTCLLGFYLLSGIGYNLLAQERQVKVRRLPESQTGNVNTEYEELAPVISGNGKVMFFVRSKHPDNIGGSEGGQDIWVTRREGNTWGKAQNIGYPINNDLDNVACGTNEDGTELYLSNHYVFSGDSLRYMRPGISVSRYENGKWTKPENIKIKGLGTIESHFWFQISKDKAHILISMMRSNLEENKEDIYICFLDQKGNYSKPVALGAQINTQEYETAPFLTADNSKLYFTRYVDESRKAHIYVSERQIVNADEQYAPENWTNWSEPVPAYKALDAEELNSPQFDAYLVLHSKSNNQDDFGFFATARPAGSRANIYEFDIKRIYQLEVRTFDAETKQALSTDLTVTASESGQNIGADKNENNQVWQYKIAEKTDDYLPSDPYPVLGAYQLKASATGYKDTEERYTVDNSKGKHTIALYLKPELVATSDTVSKPNVKEIVLEGVLFEFDSTRITSSEGEKLDRLAELLKSNKELKVSLGGYTDFYGSNAYNQNLSQRRVQSVANYLKNAGVDAAQVITNWYGENAHLTDQSGNANSDEARRLSRRVVIEEIAKEIDQNTKGKNKENKERFFELK